MSIPRFFFLLAFVCLARGQNAPQFNSPQRSTNQEVSFTLTAPSGANFRIEASTNLVDWFGLKTYLSPGLSKQTDSAAPFLPRRFYRAVDAPGTNILTGDHLPTADGEVVIHPIYHASFVLNWKGKIIYGDPAAPASFQGLPQADLILITHIHTDHFDTTALTKLSTSNTVLIVPQNVYQQLPSKLKSLARVMSNGSATNILGALIEAIPMYNMTSDRLSYHPKGLGNGYVLTIGGKRLYMSGDTEDIPEMRALTNIDIAFICMNLPYTMTIQQAANAVRQFRPGVVYPGNGSWQACNSSEVVVVMGHEPASITDSDSPRG